MAYFFFSDPHFGHRNFARGTSRWASGHRDFDTVEDMDDAIIERINAVVGPQDTLYCLGDFTMGGYADAARYRHRIKCANVHLICGNHDIRFRKNELTRNLFLSISDYKEIEIGRQHIILCHYPLSSWNRAHYGAWHLHGHVHGAPVPAAYPWLLDVGVDTNDMRPYSFDDVERIMLTKAAEAYDGVYT